VAKRETLTDRVRRAIDGSGRSRNSICEEIGLDRAVMSRFMAGKSGLALPTLDKLAEALGLRIVIDKPRKRRRTT
jgi:hypothetical protein